MKRILTFLVLSMLFVQAQAQVLFSQDFESGSLSPMTAIDVDGKTVHPNVATIAGPTWQVYGNATNKLVVSTSWFNPVGVADDWLISPAIQITQANTFLVWQAYSPDATYRDGYQVRISTTDNQIASFTDIVLTVPAELTTLNTRSLGLDAYIGQTIYFAFRNNSNDKFLLYMDNIVVEVFKNVNAIVKGVSFEKYNSVGTSVPVKVTVENHGADPLTSLHLAWTSGDSTYTDVVSGLNVPTLGSTEITHTIYYDVDEPGEFPIGIIVTNPNGVDDEDPEDNYGGRRIYGLSVQQPKKVVVEEATGTWCGWCPRGTVTMDRIAAEYADVAIPIAIHNSDPMVVPEYDAAIGATIGGYPSGHVDRKQTDIDPLDFIAAVQSLQTRRVPVQISLERSYDPITRTVTVNATGSSSVATEDNSFRFSCVVTEDNVSGTSANYNQTNYYAGGANGVMGGFESLPDPVPAAEMVYQFVARALLGGIIGLENSIPDALAANEEFDVQFTYQIPATYDENEMKVIVFVVDDETGEILNGNAVEVVEITSIPLVPVGKSSLFPNPASDVMNLTVDFQTDAPVSMKVYNTYGGLVRDLGVLNLSNGKGIEEIIVADLQAGLYILELRHKNSVTALPFTKI